MFLLMLFPEILKRANFSFPPYLSNGPEVVNVVAVWPEDDRHAGEQVVHQQQHSQPHADAQAHFSNKQPEVNSQAKVCNATFPDNM